ncbi:MAG: hypothetical protein MI976_17655 [Pseudomonadales bacterium]|nr:hypothetical protein [Pseudomonadales bacterium]
MKHLIPTTLLTALLMTAITPAAGEPIEQSIEKSLANPVRTTAEKVRDNVRKPLETLSFFGLQQNMTVIELIPGSGWYTKVLGNILKDEGKHYVAIGTDRVKDKLARWGLTKTEVIAAKTEMVPSDIKYVFDLKYLELGVKNVDMVLTFRNAHNLTPKARAELNQQVFLALKPGGIYGIIDHTRRHMQPYTRPVWRRLDPVIVIKEALDAGFEFVGYSDLHYQANDALVFDTRDERMQGPSDRFTLKFRKPE